MHRRSNPSALSATKTKSNSTYKAAGGGDLAADVEYSNPYCEQVTVETNSTQKSNH